MCSIVESMACASDGVLISHEDILEVYLFMILMLGDLLGDMF